MDKLGFKIFVPNHKTHKLTENLTIFILWMIGLSLIFTADKIDFMKSLVEPFDSYIIGTILLSICFMIAAFFRRETLNGVVKGILEIDLDKLEVDDKSFLIKDISKIDFHFINYYNQLNKFKTVNFNPLLSQGISNFIEFTDESKHMHKIYFQLQSKDQHMVLFPFITEIIKINKISFLRGTELLGIDDMMKFKISKNK